MRTSLFFLFPAACVAVALSACAAPPGEPSASDDEEGAESNLTERKVVEHEAFVTGKLASSKADAESSLKAACDAYSARQKELAGERMLDSVCGEPKNLATSAFLFGATVKTRFVVEVEQGSSSRAARTTTALGTYASGLSDAHDAWSKACDAELTRAKALFGDRLLGGGCSAPKNFAGNGYLFGSSFDAFVLPPQGKSAKLTGALRGAFGSGLVDGVEAWKKACASWSSKVAAQSGAHLAAADCGTPENTLTSGALFGSTTTIEVASGTDEAPIASGGPLVRGAYDSSLPEASTAWERACDQAAALAKELVGERLLATTCTAPKNAAGSGYLLASGAPVAIAPAGKKHVVVDAYAMAAYASSLPEGSAAIVKASTDALRANVARIGAPRVEGFEAGEPQNHAGSGYLFGAPMKIHVGYDGDLDAIASTTRVTGAASSSLPDAASSWAKACTQAAEAAKAQYGARFLAAGCGAPTKNGSTFESELTTWIAP